ncbi:hypothetical protein [Cellulomonas hominis]|uniref:hypothetical protein n=1 Tax=Cellulomonas hominis TaxID=156981 RepID=UPI001B908522|nr:hypothetical protein [Cellulomonas hominis]VTR76021.1 hypothetical protein CHMI_00777 [Cellulomonas hominis]
MAATATALTAAIGAVAGWVRADEDGFWRAAFVFALLCAPVVFSLAWTLFVAGHTVQHDRHPEDNIETRWYREATSGAFHDVLAATGLGLTVTSIGGTDLDGRTVLFGVVVLAIVDALVRLVVVRRRAS